MKPRITISMQSDGELEILLNEPGRDLLVRELQNLSEKWDHFHLGAFDGAEVPMQDKAYRPTDTVVYVAKVLLRPDAWDLRHFPHVLADTE